MKYEILVRILDKIREDAPEHFRTRYLPTDQDIEKINQARSKAFIHLYLKVLFGLLEFHERERLITDGSYDGGIDGYYIDAETKTIHLIQSKFRTNESNFENKEISLEEILLMDINRIMDGEERDENGNEYNEKIKQLQREVSGISDVARYTFKVAVLANLKEVSPIKLRQLTGGFHAEIFDSEKSYQKLVFPVISGTYFTASDITIPIDLSNKNAGSKISYTVRTKISECEITVLFVPIIEIAKIMNKYKNSILRYNPRSFLEHNGQAVNSAIRETVINTTTNEFALFNNGITMLSEETNINEKIGQKGKAQLRIKNPQIINGGQTSFTLSRIYSENKEKAVSLFSDKEVLLKIITLLDNSNDSGKINLIDEISNATNKQTPVINADRFANDDFHQKVQKKVFERYGLIYERKRGEFSDGINDGYISSGQVVERNHFWRLFYTANGYINLGFQKKLFQKNEFSVVDLGSTDQFDRMYIALHVFKYFIRGRSPHVNRAKDVYGKIYAYIQMFGFGKLEIDENIIGSNLAQFESTWNQFIETQGRSHGEKYGKRIIKDKESGQIIIAFNLEKYYRGYDFEKDLIAYFGNK